MKPIDKKTIAPQEFGLAIPEAEKLQANLPQIKAERDVLEKAYNEVLTMDIEDPKTAKIAKEVRLKIRDNRTKGIMEWHKKSKEIFLRGGQFVDAIKRNEVGINERMEENLSEIENYHQLKLEKAQQEILEKRNQIIANEQLADSIPFGTPIKTMPDEEFDKLLQGARLLKAEKDKAAAKEKELQAVKDALAPYKFIIDSDPELKTLVDLCEVDNNYEGIFDVLKKKKEQVDKDLEAARKQKEEEAEKIKKQQEAEKLTEDEQIKQWVSTFHIEIPVYLKDSRRAKQIMSAFEHFKRMAITPSPNFKQ